MGYTKYAGDRIYADTAGDLPTDIMDGAFGSVKDTLQLYTKKNGTWQLSLSSIDGAGVANKLAVWSDANTLTYDTLLHWDTASNKLGIGETSPTAGRLHVIQATDNADGGIALFDSTDNSSFRIWRSGAGAGSYVSFDDRGSSRMSIKDGKVGILNVAPSYELDVTGDIRATNQLISTVSTGTAPLAVSSTTLVSNLNVDLLDSQEGTYYLDYNNFTNTPTIGDGAITITAGTGLTGGGSFTVNQSGATGITINCSDVGSDQNIFKNIAVSGQSTIVADSNDDTLNFAAGSGITLTINATTDTLTITNSGVLSVDGNTGAITATQLLTALLTVDGSGSGLDADTLDTFEATQFLRSDADDSASGDITFSGTISLTGTSAGTDNTVLILNSSNQIVTDEIDSRVWGSTLVDGSGVSGRVAFWTDADTLSNDDSLYWDSGNNRLGIVTTSPSRNLDVNGTFRAQYIENALIQSFITSDTTAGWYPILHWGTGVGNRGKVKVTLCYVGGSWTPDTYEIEAFKHWSGSGNIKCRKWGGGGPQIGKVRIKGDASNAVHYLEVYLDANVNGHTFQARVEYDGYHDDSIALESGTLAASTNTGTSYAETDFVNYSTIDNSLSIHNYVYHNQDSDTYFGFSGADTFVAATSGISRLTIDSSGNIVLNGGATSGDDALIMSNRFRFRGDGVLHWGNAYDRGLLSWDNTYAIVGGLVGYGLGLYANGGQKWEINTSGHFIPNTNNAYDIGSATNYVRKIYVDEIFANTVDLGSFTEGSVLFANSDGDIAQDNANFFWDDTNNRLGIGINTPSYKLHVNGSFYTASDATINGNIASVQSITASGTITFSGLAAGTDNTVLVLNSSNQVVTDEIDSRVWGSSLVDGSGAINQVAFWSDSNTLTGESNLFWDSTNNRLGINDSTPSYSLDVTGDARFTSDVRIANRHLGHNCYSYSTGILIFTDIATSDGCMFELVIQGNSYSAAKGPTLVKVQGYNYPTTGTIISTAGWSTDAGFSIDVFHYNGYVYFHFDETNSFQTYSFELITSLVNRQIISVANAIKPTTGVTNSVTIAMGTLWNSYNDGAGSGLDADLLDSLDSTQFLRSDADDSASGNLTFSGTVSLTGTSAGVDNTVLVLNSSNQLVTDEIDSRVWGSSLVDGSGTANHVVFWSDSNTITGESNLFWDSTNDRLGININTPDYALDVDSNSVRLGSATQQGFNLFLQASNTAGAPAWTTVITMEGYEGRGIGTFYHDTSYVGEQWFAGINYNGSFNSWSVGYDAVGDQAEYLANSVLMVTSAGTVGINNTINAVDTTLDVHGDFKFGSYGSYDQLHMYTAGSTPSGYEGAVDVQPWTAPASGTAQQVTRFLSKTSGGTTEHDVIIENHLGVGDLFDDGGTLSYELEVEGTAAFSEYVYHRDDNDTYIRFQTNQTDIAAGGSVLSWNGTAFGVDTDSSYDIGTTTNRWATIYADDLVLTNGITAGGFTQGSVMFAGASGAITEDNANFFWDDTNNRLGLGVNSSLTYALHVYNASDAKIVLEGSTQPYIRFRETLTDKAYIQWNATGYLDFKNQENGVFRILSEDTGTDVQLQLIVDGTRQGYIYASSSNDIGFLDEGGGWAIRHLNDQGTYFADTSTTRAVIGSDLVSGSYGSMQVEANSGKGSYEGYNIAGRAVFMANSSTAGLFDDTNDAWILNHTSTETRIHHPVNGGEAIIIDSGSNITFEDRLGVGKLRFCLDDDSTDQTMPWFRSNGDNLILNAVDGDHVYLNWDTGSGGGSGDVYVGNNVYANAFYDRDDSGYYVNPASTSNLNNLQIQGALTFDSSSQIYYSASNLHDSKWELWPSSGAQLIENAEFYDDLTGWALYDNASSGATAVSRVADSTAPNRSGYVLRVTYTTAVGTPSPGLGGFYTSSFDTDVYAKGDVIVWRIMANIPSGYTLAFTSNSYGNEIYADWLTSTSGTGDWKEYIYLQKIGETGTFSSTGYFYLSGADATITWDVARVTANTPSRDYGIFQENGNLHYEVLGNKFLYTGSSGGSTNYVPYFSDGEHLASSNIYYDGTNVGIGTTTPDEKFHVEGRIIATGSSYSTNPAGPIFGQYNPTTGYIQAPAAGSIQVWTDSTALIASFLDSQDAYFVGKIGIGTSSPAQALSIERDSGRIRFTDGAGTEGALLGLLSGGAGFFQANNASGTAQVIFRADGGDNYVLGDVAIGTTDSTGHQLRVYEDSANSVVEIESNAENAYLYISAGLDGLGSEEAGIIFKNQNVNKWELYDISDIFRIYDYTGARTPFMIEANGNMRLVEGGGNIGINNSSPTHTVDMVGDVYVNSTSAEPIHIYRNSGNCSLHVQNDIDDVYFGINTSDNACIGHALDQASAPFQVTASGYVGINTSTPDTLLHVVHTSEASKAWSSTADVALFEHGTGSAVVNISAASTSSSYLIFSDPATRWVGGIQYNHSTDAMSFRINSSDRLYINSSGYVYPATNAAQDLGTSANRWQSIRGAWIMGNAGSAAAPSFSFTDDADTGFYNSGTNAIGVSLASGLAWDFASGGLNSRVIGNFLTFYGDTSQYHGIGSRDNTGSTADDLRINSYGALYINLDSNDNNTSAADFMIGNHGLATGTISELFRVEGETGHVTLSDNAYLNLGHNNKIHTTANFSASSAQARKHLLLEATYRTHDWNNTGGPFIIELFSTYYSGSGYQKWMLEVNYIDTTATGSSTGATTAAGSQDYKLRLLESRGEHADKYKLVMEEPVDTGFNSGSYDVFAAQCYIYVDYYSSVSAKITTGPKANFVETGTAFSDDDQYKVYTSGTSYTNVSTFHNTSDAVEGFVSAVYGSIFYGSDLAFSESTTSRIDSMRDYYIYPNSTGTALKLNGTSELKQVTPQSDSNYDLGTTSIRWRTLYVDDIIATNGVTAGGFTQGSVIFAGASGALAQDNSNFYWDDTNNRLGIGTTTPSNTLHVAGTARIDEYLIIDGASDGAMQLIASDNSWKYIEWKNATARRYYTGLDVSGNKFIFGGDAAGDQIYYFTGCNVGIDTSSPTYKLHVVGTGYFSSDLTTGGNFTESSSLRYKENIENYSVNIDILDKLNPVKYIKKATGKQGVGFIAEELNEILPEFVQKDDQDRPDSVSYGNMVAALTSIMKDMKSEIDNLKQEIKNLRNN